LGSIIGILFILGPATQATVVSHSCELVISGYDPTMVFLVIVGQLQQVETLKQSIILSTKFLSLLRWKQQKQDQ
jgi:hypothetical protein